MPALVFDTSQDQIVAALADDDGSLLAESGAGGRAQELLAAIQQLLDQAGLHRADIARVAVGVGPGSFTATRIGVTMARGLALALGVPLAGIDTLAAIAVPVAAAAPPHAVVWAATDARRGELFVRRYRRESGIAGFVTLPQDDVQAVAVTELARVVGSEPVGHTLTCAALAELAASATYGDPTLVLPIYGREPDAVPTAQRIVSEGVTR